VRAHADQSGERILARIKKPSKPTAAMKALFG